MKVIKIFAIAFLFILVANIGIVLTSNLKPLTASAANTDPSLDPVNFNPQIQIPGTDFDKASVSAGKYDSLSGTMTTDLLGKYIQAFYNYGLAIAGILAAIVLMAGGVLWLVSGGEASRISQAKDLIFGSIIGALILFGSWIILNTINPELLKLKVLSMKTIPKMTYCCDPTKGNVISDGNGKCAAGKLCDSDKGEQCFNQGEQSGNKFSCVNVEKYFCCEYQYNQGRYCKSVSVTDAANGAKCDPTVIYNPGGVDLTYTYKTSYNSYCYTHQFTVTDDENCLTDPCAGKDNGDFCQGQYNGWCYNEICWYGSGKEGEPCGDNDNSKCFKEQPNGNNCPSGYSRDNMTGGRDCGSNLYCCNPD